MKSRYNCKKDKSFGFFLITISVVILFLVYIFPLLLNHDLNKFDLLISSIIALPVVGVFIWCWAATYYTIIKDNLHVKSGPFFWNVPISEITKIRLDQKTFGGTWKPTLSWNSIEIKYTKYRSVFITPENQDAFLNQLKAINNNIIIKEK